MNYMNSEIGGMIAHRLYTVEEYYQYSEERFNQGLSTSEDPHYNTPEIFEYLKLNRSRTSRITKTFNATEAIKTALGKLKGNLYWVIISESWCGDAAQILPIMVKIAEESAGKIDIRVALRDLNPDLIGAFLTNGGKSIPKIVALNEAGKVLGSWGPRPANLQSLMMTWKSENLPLNESIERVHKWYADDKTVSTQNELAEFITQTAL
jgi:hypothetical protein